MIDKLIKLASQLDEKGHFKKADRVDRLIEKIAYLPGGYITDMDKGTVGTDEQHAAAIVADMCTKGAVIEFTHRKYLWKYNCEEETYDLVSGPGVSDKGRALFSGISKSDTGSRLKSWNTLNGDKLSWDVKISGKGQLNLSDFISYEKERPAAPAPEPMTPPERKTLGLGDRVSSLAEDMKLDGAQIIANKEDSKKAMHDDFTGGLTDGNGAEIRPDATWYLEAWRDDKSRFTVLLMFAAFNRNRLYKFSYVINGNIGVQGPGDEEDGSNRMKIYDSWDSVVSAVDDAMDHAHKKFPATKPWGDGDEDEGFLSSLKKKLNPFKDRRKRRGG